MFKNFKRIFQTLFYTFRGRMLLSLLFVSLVPIIVYSYYTIHTAQQSIKKTGDQLKTDVLTYVEHLYRDNINQQADLLSNQLLNYRKQLVQLKTITEEILEEPFIDERIITLTKEAAGYYWEEPTGDQSNVGISANANLSDELFNQLEQTKKLDKMFKQIYKDNEAIVAIYFISSESSWRIYPPMDVKNEIDSGYLRADVDLTKETFYKVTDKLTASDREVGWTEPYEDITHRDRMFSISTPIYVNDEKIGIVAIDITIDRAVEHLMDFTFNDDHSYALLVDHDYNVIAYQDKAQTDMNVLSQSYIRDIVESPTIIIESIVNENKLFLSASIEPMNWHVIFVIPETEITNYVTTVINEQLDHYNSHFIKQMISVFTVIIILIVGISLAFWSNFTQPMRSLLHGIKTFQSNELDEKVPRQKLKEFDTLSNSFNMMTIKINELTNRYRLLNKDLENKVNERTEQLKALNSSLIKTNRTLSIMEQERKKLLNDITHDLKTPLMLVTGFVNAIEKQYIRDEDFNVYMKRISRHLNTINQLVKNIDLISKKDDPYTFEQQIPLNIAQFISEIKKDFASQHNITFFHKDTQSWIRADQYSLKRALLNLIENSIKYSDGNVSICISVSSNEEYVYITVKDDGWGIPSHLLPKIFQRHFRSTQAILSNKTGDGLGLAIVKDIVESHHGKITVESTLHQGTTFTLQFPKLTFV